MVRAACEYSDNFAENAFMSYEASGRLVAVYDTIQRSEKFRTREFVIETTEAIRDRTINNYIKFQLVQDRTDLIDRFRVNDMIKVKFNIKGSRWEKNGMTNYITNLDAWRIENQESAADSGQGGADTMQAFTPDPFPKEGGPADDLPF
jgi:hypothetical protein